MRLGPFPFLQLLAQLLGALKISTARFRPVRCLALKLTQFTTLSTETLVRDCLQAG